VLTTASLMVGASHAADAVDRAAACRHYASAAPRVVGSRPVLPASELSELVGRRERSAAIWRVGRGDLLGQARRQLRPRSRHNSRPSARPPKPRSLQCAQHFHLHRDRTPDDRNRPPFRPACGPRAESNRARCWTNREAARAPAWLTLLGRSSWRRRLVAAGMLVPDSVFGLAWSGAMTTERLAGLIRHAPDGLS